LYRLRSLLSVSDVLLAFLTSFDVGFYFVARLRQAADDALFRLAALLLRLGVVI
jgi:hypothetical protein